MKNFVLYMMYVRTEYNIQLSLEVILYFLQDSDLSTLGSASSAASDKMSSDGWLSKRQKRDSSEPSLTSRPETTVISR